MSNKNLANLTPEEREELLESVEKTTVDEFFMDMFCEIFNTNPADIVMTGEGVPNE